MNAFLATMRKIFLGGITVLILSLFIEGKATHGIMFYCLLSCVPLYLLFAFFTWLKGKMTVERVSEAYQVDLPDPNFLLTFFKGLLFDIISPFSTLFGLFGELSNKFFLFLSTYVIIGAYLIVWFFFI